MNYSVRIRKNNKPYSNQALLNGSRLGVFVLRK